MNIESPRLRIVPLDHQTLQIYLEADGKLERELGLADVERTISPEFTAVIREKNLSALADGKDDWRFRTLWIMFDKESRQLVGDLGFKGPPSDRGEVEIGYGTHDPFQGKGYMTEAIEALAGWAFRQPGVRAVIAETDIGNDASHRVLEKNGFVRYKTIDTIMVWWRLEKDKLSKRTI